VVCGCTLFGPTVEAGLGFVEDIDPNEPGVRRVRGSRVGVEILPNCAHTSLIRKPSASGRATGGMCIPTEATPRR
jgi:hypothetical protein